MAAQKPMSTGGSADDGSAGSGLGDVRMANATGVVMTKTRAVRKSVTLSAA